MAKHNTPETYEQDYKLVKNTQDAADIKKTMMQDKEASYEAKYKALLTRYGLERTETDYEKDMKEYAPRIKAAIDKTKEANKTASVKDISRPAREERDLKALSNHETKVSVNKSGGATAETTASVPKRRASIPSTSKPATTRNTQSLRSDATRKAESSTPSTSKPAPKPATTPREGYAVEEQNVRTAKMKKAAARAITANPIGDLIRGIEKDRNTAKALYAKKTPPKKKTAVTIAAAKTHLAPTDEVTNDDKRIGTNALKINTPRAKTKYEEDNERQLKLKRRFGV